MWSYQIRAHNYTRMNRSAYSNACKTMQGLHNLEFLLCPTYLEAKMPIIRKGKSLISETEESGSEYDPSQDDACESDNTQVLIHPS